MKASSRLKQLQCYKGNWATIKIMKTLLKNRCTYRNHIGSLDKSNDDMKDINGEGGLKDEITPEEEDDIYQDEIDDIYEDEVKMDNMDEKIDENQSGDDGNGKELNFGKNEDGNGGKGLNNSENGFEEEVGGINIKRGNGDGNCISSAKKAGTKRKASEDNEPAIATIVKRKKLNGSGGHPVATQSKRKYSKK